MAAQLSIATGIGQSHLLGKQMLARPCKLLTGKRHYNGFQNPLTSFTDTYIVDSLTGATGF